MLRLALNRVQPPHEMWGVCASTVRREVKLLGMPGGLAKTPSTNCDCRAALLTYFLIT